MTFMWVGRSEWGWDDVWIGSPHLTTTNPTHNLTSTHNKNRWPPVATALRLLAPLWCHQPPHPLLHGFQSRREAEALLQGTRPGTFLVRFSTSHLGLLAISFVVAAPAANMGEGAGVAGDGGGGVVQHCLVRVTPQGCDLFVETGRKRYETFPVRGMSVCACVWG